MNNVRKVWNDKTAQVKFFGYLSVLALVAVLYVGLQILQDQNSNASMLFNQEQNLREYKAAQKRTIPIDHDDPVLGPLNSPVEIIVFSDFECPSCRYFSLVLNTLEQEYKGKFHVVYKYYPLNKACNSFVDKDVHPRACEAAFAAEAARKQEKFWEYHNSLFITNLSYFSKNVCSLADSLGLNHEKFERDRTSTEAMAKIKRTTTLANDLGVSGTPTVFLNGRQIKNFGLPSVKSLIEYELESKKK
jgi:protein-disulfide isomerase